MAFYYLLLGHLIGDFSLQTNKIAENKGKDWKWNLLHTSLITLCTLVFSYPFGTILISLLFLNGIIHFFLDFYKEKLCRLFHLNSLGVFIFDQFIHILLLYIFSTFAVYGNEPVINFETVQIFTILVVATSFSAVFTQLILSELYPRTGCSFFENGEKHLGICTRVYMVIIFYLSFTQSAFYLTFLVLTAALFLRQFNHDWNKWMSPSQLAMKMLLDAVISVVCIFPFIYDSMQIYANIHF